MFFTFGANLLLYFTETHLIQKHVTKMDPTIDQNKVWTTVVTHVAQGVGQVIHQPEGWRFEQSLSAGVSFGLRCVTLVNLWLVREAAGAGWQPCVRQSPPGQLWLLRQFTITRV